MKLADRLGNVTRRGFLSGTAGAIATGAAVAMPQETVESLNKSMSLEQTAHALYEVVGRYSEQSAPIFTQAELRRVKNPSLDFSMECMRYWSVDEIQHLLKPLYGGAS